MTDSLFLGEYESKQSYLNKLITPWYHSSFFSCFPPAAQIFPIRNTQKKWAKSERPGQRVEALRYTGNLFQATNFL